ncbi:MAG: TIGR01777 family protein [Acidobacteria bacterium]|nr:TIGR01777 family protein [Acidobacteriota bacterium]MCG3194528.1 Epimerase family protein [Thermoanaerobaculia bacterium]
MKVVLTGGSGFIGRALTAELLKKGHEVVIVSRNPVAGARPGVTQESWGAVARALDGAGAIVNLAGEPVAQRWTKAVKDRIRTSRLGALGRLAEGVRSASRRPSVLVSASAIGYYGDRGDETLTEESPAGSGFLPATCVEWEAAAARFPELGVRTAVVRIGLVLGREGGALAKMLPVFRLGGGGPLGNGQQWMSWIHLEDLVRLLIFPLENQAVQGSLNGTSPAPVRNREFTVELARALSRPAFLPAPAFGLRLVLGEMASVLLESQKVLPERTTQLGFEFRFQTLGPALSDLVG